MIDPRMVLLSIGLIIIGVVAISVSVGKYLLRRHWPDQ